MATAQEPDGYIYTARTLGDRHERVGTHRWYCDDAHELYCMGHMIEAAVAHHETTGKDNFLKVACKAADMMRRTFGPGKDQIWFLPGHEEIELALCKLYKATGNKKYLDLAMDLVLNGSAEAPCSFGFADAANGDFRFVPGAAILKVCPGFQLLPLERIAGSRDM